MGNGALTRNYVEDWSAQPPPRAGQQAVGEKPIMQDVAILYLFSPLRLKIKGISRRQQSGPGMDDGHRRAGNHIELSFFAIDVVVGTVAINFLAALEVFKINVAAGLHITGICVVVDLVGTHEHVGGFHADHAAQVPEGSVRLLSHGLDEDVLGVGGVGAGNVNRLVGICTNGTGRGRRGRQRRAKILGEDRAKKQDQDDQPQWNQTKCVTNVLKYVT